MKKLLTIIVFTATLFSCKEKKEAIVPPAQTKENIAGLYKLTALTLKTGSSAETSIIDSYITTCQRDDLQQLKVDLTFNYIDAGIRCMPAGDHNAAWSLPAPGKILINGVNFDIVSFTGPVLMLSNVQAIMGVNTTFTSTLTKQ